MRQRRNGETNSYFTVYCTVLRFSYLPLLANHRLTGPSFIQHSLYAFHVIIKKHHLVGLIANMYIY